MTISQYWEKPIHRDHAAISNHMDESTILGKFALTTVQVALDFASCNFLLWCSFSSNCTLVHSIHSTTSQGHEMQPKCHAFCDSEWTVSKDSYSFSSLAFGNSKARLASNLL